MKLLFILLLTFFDADFVQTRTSQLLAAPEVINGHIRYEAPDAIEWTYASSEGQQTAALPPRMLSYIRQFIAAENEPSDGWHELMPLPKQLNRMFASIRILYQDGIAREVVLTEPSGDSTAIRFINPNAK